MRALHCVVLPLLLVACGSSEGEAAFTPSDGLFQDSGAGTPQDGDASDPVDATTSADAAIASDAGGARDTGPPADAATVVDAAVDGAATFDATAPRDAGSTLDAGPSLDAGALRDAALVADGAAATDAATAVDAGIPPAGNLGCGGNVIYTRITHNLTTTDLSAVAFAPDGATALLVGRNGTVLRYREAQRDLALVGQPTGAAFSAVRFLSSGDAVLAGSTTVSAVAKSSLYRYTAADGALARVAPTQTLNVSNFAALDATGATNDTLAVTFATNVLSVYRYDRASDAVSYAAGYGTTTGPTGIATGTLSGSPISVIAGGVNGTELLRYDATAPVATRIVRVNEYYSNLTAIAARPTGDEFFLCDLSRNLVRYDGTLTALTGPFTQCNAVAFSSDGRNALFVGRPRGTTLVGSVALYRGAKGAFAAANVTDVSVPNFAQNPYQADANAQLLGVAFRPNACDGLIVGAKGFGPNAYGMVIRFALTP